MDPLQLSERTRRRLVGVLTEDRLRDDRLLRRLAELRNIEGIPVFSSALYLLAHVRVAEPQAEVLLRELLAHRRRLSEALGRDPGLPVAAIDFLTNVKRLLVNPAIVELSELELTERSAVTDSLTELFNRRYFENALRLEIRRSRRYHLELGLLILDLDEFKSINDLYGHPFGDLVLRGAGEVIRKAVRESDIACRFGGEEFAIILPETDRTGAYALAERVRSRLQRRFTELPVEDRAVTLTISGGIACYPEDGSTAAGLISRADQALYHSKTTGKNRNTPYHSERRAAIRYAAQEALEASLARESGDPVSARPINLSLSGALVETPAEVVEDDPVRLALGAAPHATEVAGHVVRVDEPQDAGPAAGRRVAVVFDRPLAGESLEPHVARGRRPVPARGGDA